MDDVYKEMFYSFEKPAWHGLGIVSQEKTSAVDVIVKRLQGAFPVLLRPVKVQLNDEWVETKEFAIVRGRSVADPTEVILDYCTDHYQPLQPIDVAEKFDNSVCEPVETLGFLGKGQDMFLSWVMPKFEVVADDLVEMFGIVRVSFTTMRATHLFVSTYRPVCRNTLNLAEGWAKHHTDASGTRGSIWKGKGTNPNLLRDLGYWMEHVQTKALFEADLVQGFFAKLAKTPIKNDAVAQDILGNAFPNRSDNSDLFPRQLRETKAQSIVDYNMGQAEIRDGIFNIFSSGTPDVSPDAWGLLNAGTKFFCHVQPSKKPIGESVMFGSRQKKSVDLLYALKDFAN